LKTTFAALCQNQPSTQAKKHRDSIRKARKQESVS
jgi:hypothetical protein